MAKTILVLGGGIGGVVCAGELRKKLSKDHKIILVDREQRHVFSPSLLWLMTGLRKSEKISQPLDRLKKKGIEVVRGEIEAIDPKAKSVTVSGKKIKADYLVIALGAVLAPEKIPGLTEAGHTYYSLGGAEGLRDARKNFRSGRMVLLTATPAYKCPAAPYEAAMLLEYDCQKRGIRDDVQIDFYAAEPGPMPVAGAAVTAAVRGLVEERGIGYHPGHMLSAVDPDKRRLTFANGVTADFDFLVYVPPHVAPKVVADAGMLGDAGWVPVDRGTMETKFPGVFAIGDVNGIPLDLGKPLPMAGVFAHGEAEVVVSNIVHAITGKGKTVVFDGHGECFIEAGHGKAGFGRGKFYAEPVPTMKLYKPGRHWHAGKLLFEKDWLRRWF
ncbi:MAG: NAD(P)/FAD-dependent oxidoreductase [Alphaproteobacteria bacterium]|jgi:sulfide:quinone oxidoreductase|nr:NAD(P)/FAD-dependent oxidoreductase [Alphaproteobacteria bacterium]MBT4710037.1 NAD(P)/FAD-dependent oxidoreductase [Alphaproteobacteria bacterium]